MKLKITIPNTLRMRRENNLIPFVYTIENKILYTGRIIFDRSDFTQLSESKSIIVQKNIVNIPAGFTAYFDVKYDENNSIEMKFIELCNQSFEGDYILHTDTIVCVDGIYVCNLMFEHSDFVNSVTYLDRDKGFKITFYLAIIPVNSIVYTYQYYNNKLRRKKEIVTPEGLGLEYDMTTYKKINEESSIINVWKN